MASANGAGFYVSWEQVMAFFAMSEEALKAKTAANEARWRCISMILFPSARTFRSMTFFVLGQALRGDADSLREELEEKRAAYIKVATLILIAPQMCLMVLYLWFNFCLLDLSIHFSKGNISWHL